jgi:hypothetical protein
VTAFIRDHGSWRSGSNQSNESILVFPPIHWIKKKEKKKTESEKGRIWGILATARWIIL